MVDLRKNMHKDIVDEYQNNKHLLKTSINYSSEVEKMGIFRAPLSAFAPRSKSAKAYHSLWKEFKSLITTKNNQNPRSNLIFLKTRATMLLLLLLKILLIKFY